MTDTVSNNTRRRPSIVSITSTTSSINNGSTVTSLSSILNIRRRPTATVRFVEQDSDNTKIHQHNFLQSAPVERFTEDFLPETMKEEEQNDRDEFKRFALYKTKSDRAKLAFSVHQLGQTLTLEDDVSLLQPSTYLKYHNNDVHIFDLGTDSIILEKEESSNTITAKYSHDGTFGFSLIRGYYVFFALLMILFLTSFAIQILLFLFLGIASKTGLHNNDGLENANHGFEILILRAASICSLPVIIFGLSNTMAIASEFVTENWNGQRILKSMISNDYAYIIDWVSFTVFVFVPFFTCTITLLIDTSSRWWFYTLASCQFGVFIYFIVFYIVFIFKDLALALRLVKAEKEINDPQSESTFFSIAYNLWLWSMRHQLSGKDIVKYTSIEGHDIPQEETYMDARDREFASSSINSFSRVTILLADITRFYYLPQYPKRLYHVEEVYQNYVIRNRYTWGLDRFYCRNLQTPISFGFVEGKSSLSKPQTLSSTICFFLVLSMKLFFLIAVLIWFRVSILIGSFLTLLFIAVLSKDVVSGLRFLRQVKKLEMEEKFKRELSSRRNIFVGEAEEDKSIYVVSGNFRITEPSEGFCIFIYACRVLLFFFFPIIVHFISGNIPIGVLFCVLSSFTFCMGYLSSSIALAEIGSADGISALSSDWRQNWRDNHVLKTTSGMSTGLARKVWGRIFLVFSFVFGALTSGAYILRRDDGNDIGLRYTSDFEYKGQGALQYSSCQMVNSAVETSSTTLLDYSFLSTITYEANEITNTTLITWFRDANVINHEFIVDNFRKEYEKIHSKSSVRYKLFGFPDKGVGVVSIRGTLNLWDVAADVQLYAGVVIAQIARGFIPMGHLFTPLFEFLVEIIAKLESNNLEKVSYYKQTTAFIKHIKALNLYNEIFITGHSLGGGIAMISGAQTETFAIAISGPNAKLGSNTFTPTISKESIDKYAFNVIPERDIVAMIDDPSKRYENIECRVKANGFYNCHMPRFSFCELMLVCGSNGRPVPCICAKELGYDQPSKILMNNATISKTFEEVCEDSYL